MDTQNDIYKTPLLFVKVKEKSYTHFNLLITYNLETYDFKISLNENTLNLVKSTSLHSYPVAFVDPLLCYFSF